MFSEKDLKDLNDYIELVKDLPFVSEFTEFRDYIQNNPEFEAFPVIVLSHDFNKKRSKFLTKLNGYTNYVVVTSRSNKEKYTNFKCHFYDDSEIPGLANKRKFIIDLLQNKNIENAFLVEDDCSYFTLPYKTDKTVNERFKISYDFLFKFWTFLVKKYNYKYSGLMNNTELRFRDIKNKPNFTKHNGQGIQVIQINSKFAKENGIQYDPESGWEDYDILIQEMIYGNGTEVLPITYRTPALTEGVSTFSNLPERCIENTSKLLSKWGFDLVKLDLKMGIFNAKVNWIKAKKAISENVPLKSLVKPVQITETDKESIRNIMNSNLDSKEKKLKIEKLLGQPVKSNNDVLKYY